MQQHPSAAVFPGAEGEALAQTQARAVAAVRAWDASVTASAGPEAVWLACSHGDVIKALLADALGAHLDLFQRIVVDPCSVSVVRYTDAPAVRAADQRHRRGRRRAAAAAPPRPPAAAVRGRRGRRRGGVGPRGAGSADVRGCGSRPRRRRSRL